VKLRLRVIADEMVKDTKSAAEECEELMEYMNLVIEDVRRLSLSLSPTVLEDLGLTSALRWLVDNLSSRSVMEVVCDITEVDHLISKDNWIVVYRVIQEALTNIGKHADAENVAVVIRRDGGRVEVLVQDDGVGFDQEKLAGNGASKRGLGLTTMSERLGVIGGELELTSREGKGTRVAFSLPVHEWRD
jgi:signal transduction histidine kinase